MVPMAMSSLSASSHSIARRYSSGLRGQHNEGPGFRNCTARGELLAREPAAEEARHAAEPADAARKGILAAINHDLRQPLQAMRLFHEILKAKAGPVFDDFSQVGNQGLDNAQGLGLGLAIVRRLSALLGHPVSVTSSVDKGSIFSIELDLAAKPTKALSLHFTVPGHSVRIRAEPLDDLAEVAAVGRGHQVLDLAH